MFPLMRVLSYSKYFTNYLWVFVADVFEQAVLSHGDKKMYSNNSLRKMYCRSNI